MTEPDQNADSAEDSQGARLRYWVEQMDNSRTLLQQMTRYPIEECGEGLVSIPAAASAAGIEMVFSETKLAGLLDRHFIIREGLIDDLMAAGRQMNENGWVLKIEEGFRTREMQTQLGRLPAVFDLIVRMCAWEHGASPPPVDLVQRRAGCLVANTPVTGTHMCGAAVDISVLSRDDHSEVWRGAPYLEMSEKTPMQSPFVEPRELDNRMAITKVMEAHGFLHYPGEFWHYNKGDALYQMMTRSGQPGRYGPVHFDAATGQVHAYDDLYGVLTEPAVALQLIEASIARIEQSGSEK